MSLFKKLALLMFGPLICLLFLGCKQQVSHKCSSNSNNILKEDLLDSLNFYSKSDTFTYSYELNESDSLTIYCENWFYVFQIKDLESNSISYFDHQNNSSYIISINTISSKNKILVKTNWNQIQTDHTLLVQVFKPGLCAGRTWTLTC